MFFDRRHHGFSLIEVLVALAISSVVIGGTFAVFLNTKKTQNFVQAKSELQEAGRLSLDYLKRNIRMIGYQGCISFDNSNIRVVAKDITKATLLTEQIRGYVINDNTWNNGLNFASITTSARVGSSAFSIGRMSSISNMILEDMTTASSEIKLSATPDIDIQDGELVFISDCQTADLFKASNNPLGNNKTTVLHQSDVNTVGQVIKPYKATENANVARYEKTVYFVGNTLRVNTSGEAIFALYQARSPDYGVEEVFEGVEQMQVLYGERLGNNNIRYVPADQAGPAIIWENVISLKLALLLSSHDGVKNTEDTATYDLLGTSIVAPTGTTTSTSTTHSGGRRLKSVFSTTVKIRNRGL